MDNEDDNSNPNNKPSDYNSLPADEIEYIYPKFRIVKNVSQPKPSWFEERKELIYEVIIFFIIFIIGLIIVASEDLCPQDWQSLFKSILFASGLISLFDSVHLFVFCKSLFLLLFTRKLPTFDTIVAPLLAICFILIALCLELDEPLGSYGASFVWSRLNAGVIFLDSGFIFFATRLYYVIVAQPNPSVQAKMLEEEVKELKNSVARGLAEGYYYNFLKMCAKIFDETSEVKVFYIMIPKVVEGDDEDNSWIKNGNNDIRGLIKEMKSLGILNENETSLKGDGGRPNADKLKKGQHFVDVPTTLSVLIEAIKCNDDKFDVKRFNREVGIFSDHLLKRLHEGGDKLFKVIELEIINLKEGKDGYTLAIDFSDFDDTEGYEGNKDCIRYEPRDEA